MVVRNGEEFRIVRFAVRIFGRVCGIIGREFVQNGEKVFHRNAPLYLHRTVENSVDYAENLYFNDFFRE